MTLSFSLSYAHLCVVCYHIVLFPVRVVGGDSTAVTLEHNKGIFVF